MTRKHALIALKAVISIGLIWFVLRDVDLADVVSRVSSMNPLWLMAAIAIALVLVVIGGVRWCIVLRAINAPLSVFETTRLFYLGAFFNQTLPSSVGGDPVRMYFAYRKGLTVRKAVASVFLERLVTVLGLIVLVDCMIPSFLGRLDPEHAIQDWLPMALLVINLIAFGGIGFLLLLNFLPETLRNVKIFKAFYALASEAGSFVKAPFSALGALFFGCVNHALVAVLAFALAQGLDVDIALLDSLVVVPLTLLVTTIPISIAGWGVRETAMIFGFGVVGVAATQAVLVSLVLGLLGLVVALPGGILWFRMGEKVDTRVLEQT